MAAGLMAALALLLVAVAAAFAVGRYPVTPADLWSLLASRLGLATTSLPPAAETVVLQIRGPRVAAALAVGAALASAGAAFQGLFRNPLVSPDILGASAGAALGAVLGIFFSLGIVGIQAAAFAGGLLSVALVTLFGTSLRGGDPALALLLTGIVVGSLIGAGIGLVKVLADPYNQLPAITFWLLGSLSGAHAADLLPLLGSAGAGIALLVALRWKLDAMSLPDDEARSLGLPTTALRLAVIAAATLATAASVAAAGIVGWVGLVVPHLARFLVGPSFPRLLPASALLGGSFLLLIDTLARSIAAVEVPLGILTAVVGTPFFVALLRRTRGGWS